MGERYNMVYPFKCPACERYDEVWRPSSEYQLPEICSCGEIMDRVWTPSRLQMMTPRRTPAGMIEIGNEHSASITKPRERELVTDRELSEWARTTTEFSGLKD